MYSANTTNPSLWGKWVLRWPCQWLLVCFCACGIMACAGGVKNTPFSITGPITDQDRALIAVQEDTAGFLAYIEEYSNRTQTREKKNQLLRLSHYAYTSAEGGRRAALALAHSAFLVADVEADAQKQTEIAEVGAQAALDAGASALSPEASYYYALNLGLVMRHKGLAALAKLDDLKRALDHCQDQTSLDYGGPGRVLGMLYLKAPAWPQGIGDIDAALELLQAVAQEYPDFPQNRMFYAEALYGEGLLDKARDQLTKASNDVTPEKWGPDYFLIWKKEIDTLLTKINQ